MHNEQTTSKCQISTWGEYIKGREQSGVRGKMEPVLACVWSEGLSGAAVSVVTTRLRSQAGKEGPRMEKNTYEGKKTIH